MNLRMKDLDIDTYNATFARLANAAGWEVDAKGSSSGLQARLGLKDGQSAQLQ
jgi:2-methylisocitrate lyase-like PEP mutase family enzyme